MIMRGLPGSGKSFRAEEFNKHYTIEGYKSIVLSTDQFWIDKETNEYNFQGQFIGRAHEWNRGRCAHAMRVDKYEVIIIDNTNTTLKEMLPYIEMAAEFGYDVEIYEPRTDWKYDVEECFKRNTHGVPKESIKSMMDRWQRVSINTYY